MTQTVEDGFRSGVRLLHGLVLVDRRRLPLLSADAIGLVGRGRPVSGRRLGQAAARRLAGERRVFFLRRPERVLNMLQEALGANSAFVLGCADPSASAILPDRSGGRSVPTVAWRICHLGRQAAACRRRPVLRLALAFLLAALLARLMSGSSGQPAAFLARRRLPAAAGCRLLGGTTSGERSRYSMPARRPCAAHRPFRMPLKILVSSNSSSSSSAACANGPAQPIDRRPCRAWRQASEPRLQFAARTHDSSSCRSPEPIELTAVCGFRRQ